MKKIEVIYTLKLKENKAMKNLGKIIIQDGQGKRLDIFMYEFKSKFFRDDLFLESESDYQESMNSKKTLFDSHNESMNDLAKSCEKLGYTIIEREC